VSTNLIKLWQRRRSWQLLRWFRRNIFKRRSGLVSTMQLLGFHSQKMFKKYQLDMFVSLFKTLWNLSKKSWKTYPNCIEIFRFYIRNICAAQTPKYSKFPSKSIFFKFLSIRNWFFIISDWIFMPNIKIWIYFHELERWLFDLND